MTEFLPFLDMRGPEFLKLYIGSLIAATLVAMLIRWLASFPFDYPNNNPPLNPYDVSFLMGGKCRTMEAAIAALVQEKILRIDTTNGHIHLMTGLVHGAHPALRAVHDTVAAAGTKGLAYVKAIRTAPSGLFPDIEEKLEYYGLIVPWGRGMLVRIGTFTLMALVGAMGAAKISIGLERKRPVEILVILTCVAVGIALYMLFNAPHRSVRGNRYAKDFAERADILRAAASTGAPGLASGDVAMVAGLYGVGILGGVLLSDLRTVHQRFVQPVSDGTSSDSSSCGGSSCGGGGCGGGGCGGCGS
jgi:uncharacterized protein (TIGR04222 family)